MILNILILVSGALGKLYDEIYSYTDNDIKAGLLFFLIIGAASFLISLPVGYYKQFVLEERYGFNKNTRANYVIDNIKSIALSVVIGGILISILLYLVYTFREHFWLLMWVVVSLFSVGASLLYTRLILPLFNKLTPLGEGSLRAKIETYAAQVDFAIGNILIMDSSRRTTKANAFFSGFGREKRIVLFDNLIEKHNEEEVVAVLAHEVGHNKKKHILIGTVISILQTGLILFILSHFIFSEDISQALGGEGVAVPVNLIGFLLLFQPISTVLGYLGSMLSRKHEFEADKFAAVTYGSSPLISSLKKLYVHSLSNPDPHPFDVELNYSHPPLLQRVKRLESYDE